MDKNTTAFHKWRHGHTDQARHNAAVQKYLSLVKCKSTNVPHSEQAETRSLEDICAFSKLKTNQCQIISTAELLEPLHEHT